jgi:hypothetical protein
MRWLLAVLILWALPALAAPRQVPLDATITLHLDVGVIAVITLPEPIDAWMMVHLPQQYTTDKNGSTIGVALLDKSYSGRLFVFGKETGKRYRIDFQYGPEPFDTEVVMATRPKTVPPVKTQPATLGTFLLAARTSTPFPWEATPDLPLPAVPDPRLALGKTQTRASGALLFQTIEVTNITDTALVLDVRYGSPLATPSETVVTFDQWGFPPRTRLRALAVHDEQLAPGATTLLYAVLCKGDAHVCPLP